jgi:amino acid adenylation domain-containing protein
VTTLAVHERFAQRAERAPSATAVIDGDRRLTYRELDERAELLAGRLRSAERGAGSLVGVSLPRSLDLVVAIVGILKAGAAYLPLDPGYPRDRLDFMLADSRVDTVVASTDAARAWARPDVRLVSVEQQPAEEPSRPPSDRERPADDSHRANLDDLAYVMYTSGSTGKPKGVMISHRNVARLFDATQHWYGFDSADVWTLFHSYAFDFSVWEMWGALTYGGSLVIVPHAVARTPRLFRELVAKEGVTVLNQTPSAFYQFMQADLLTRDRDQLALRYVIFGGEALDFQSLVPWFDRQGDERPRLINMYGITETTVHVTYRLVSREDAAREGASLIGVPIPDLQLHILGPDMEPVPVGELGELYVGGAGVSRGYLHRPELTRERFLPDPFAGGSSATLYKTGDLVRARPDGELEYHGRADDQVQLRGFRIELGEVRTVLAAHPAVLSAAVTVDGPYAAQRLVAYVVRSSEGLSEPDLREWMAARLPEHMVPSVTVFLDRLPLTANGKVDLQALPRPGRRRPSLGERFVAPRDDLERYLAGIWEEILELDGIGVHDRFFDLGGTSLHAARFVNRVAERLGAQIFDITVFTAPTIAAYAHFLVEHYRDAVGAHFELPAEPAALRDGAAVVPSERVTPELIEQMRRVIPARPSGPAPDGSPPLDPAVFILAPPRSGTTLLRVMLAGHPQLFGAAELLLLGFDTLRARRRAYSGKFSLWREGLVRAMMEIHACSADVAEEMMQSAEDEGLTTKEFYRRIQRWIAPQMLVDKSPAYALDPAALQKAERDFREPLYIHLTRHPYAMVQSFVSNRIEQVLYLEPHPFQPRQLAEMVWTISNQTVLEFLRDVPEGRQYRLRFEDLVTDPEHAMRALCRQLGLPFDHQLVRPYEGLESKMVNGLHPESTPMGDPSFVTHGEIRNDVADRWLGVQDDDFLGDVTWQLAELLGYPRTTSPASPATAERSRRRLLLQQSIRRGERATGAGIEESGE